MTITTDLIGTWVAFHSTPAVKLGVIRGTYLASNDAGQVIPRVIVETHDSRSLLHLPLDCLSVYPPWATI